MVLYYDLEMVFEGEDYEKYYFLLELFMLIVKIYLFEKCWEVVDNGL